MRAVALAALCVVALAAPALVVDDDRGATLAPVAAARLTVVASSAVDHGAPGRPAVRPPPQVPSAAALRSAWSFARAREGVVSIAVVDTEGELRGRAEWRRYPAASVVKAMLLAAELRRLEHERAPLDPATRSTLRAMIAYSDNAAADSAYARVGDPGLAAVAGRAGMERFRNAGHWGNAQIAAADMALFFADLDRMLPRRFRAYGKGLLGSVIESQSWGIPRVAGAAWAVRFKGGWLPDHALVHQAAELRSRDGDRALSLVVLTDDQPSHTYGIATVEGVAARLLSR